MKALLPVWATLWAAVLATAVYGVVLYLIERSGWRGLVLPWIDATRYVVFFVVFFVGVLMARK
ncbi:MAG TPA: hypothetical protein VK630_06640 [Reyranella sp.]|nr:hypothetical protein [Reyranella sp.]